MKNYSLTKTYNYLFCIILLLASVSGLNGQGNGSDKISYPLGTPDGIVSAATSVDGTSATLNGLVNPNNESTTVDFEYSQDNNFSEESGVVTVTADQSPLTGNGYMVVSKAISGLTPGTTYYFRIISVNGSATDTSPSTSFTTNSPADVATGIASPVTTTTALLSGTVNANNNDTTVTFEYGLTTSYGTTVTADQSPVTGTSDTAVSKSIGSLTPNTTYHFRAVGVNTLGTTYGEDMTFFTAAQAAPTATTDYATYHLTTNTATLNGTVNANNSDTTVTFEYGLTTSYGTTVTADQSPVLGSSETAVSKLISGLTPDTTYHYRVVATNSIGTTNGADMTFYNTASPYVRTTAATAIANTSATLNSVVNPKRFDDSNDTDVWFEYGLTASYGDTIVPVTSPADGSVELTISAALTGLTPNTTYHYRIVADNPNGTGTGEDMTFTTSSLPIVTTNGATPVATTSATLNGTVNANGDSTTVTFEYGTTTSYGTTVTADQSPVSGNTDTWVSKAVSSLATNTTYHYRVVGTNSSGTSNGEDQTFTTGISPATVTTDAATAVDTTTTTLNGTVNANGNDTIVSFEYGFSTSYGQTASASPSPVSGSTNTAISGNLSSLTPGTTYHYRAVGSNAGGTIYGTDMTFTTKITPTVSTDAASGVNTTVATLNGTVNANGDSTTVTFEYGTTTSYGTTVTADQSPVTGSINTAVSKAISGLTPGTTYHYRVVGTNSAGTSNGADMTFFTSAPMAPTATTDAASSVTFSGAMLNGTVNANNASTTVTFEYGTSVAYGTTVTADQSPVSGSGSVSVSKEITGLSGNTTYHYRVVGTNANGTTNGADMTFVTGALTPSVVTEAATNVLFTSATINGTANGNVAGATVTFEYGLTVAYGTTVSGTPSSVPGDSTDYAVLANITGLTPGTTYHFRAVVDNAFVSPVNGADMTFTTPIGPDATTNAASSITSTSAILNGSVNANNTNTTVTFEYGIDTNYGLSVSASPSQVTGNTNTAVLVPLSLLIPNTTYHYRVVAVNANGSNYGSDMTFTTTAVAPTVTTVAASSIGGTGATLNGTVNPEGDSTTVTFEYGTTIAYGTTVTADQSPVTDAGTTAVDKAISGLTGNTLYHYRVVGQNGAGTTNGADMTFTTGTNTPNATTSAASGIATTSATLNGIANANGSSTTVTFEYGTTTSYGKTATADQSPVSGSSDTAVSNTVGGLIASTTYHYRVVAQNAFGTTYGADMSFLTPGSAPDSTTDAATSVGATSATLNGTINANSDSTTVTFEYGTTTSYGTTVTATQSPVTGDTDTAVSYGLSGLTLGVTYHYRVKGQNAFGTTSGADMTFATSTIPTVTTDAASAVGNGIATLNGTVNANGDSTTVTFEYGTSTAYGTTVTATPSPVTGTTATSVSAALTGLTNGTTYHYRAVGVNGSGTTNGADMTFTPADTVPTVTTDAATAVGDATATLNGTVNANNSSTTVTFEYGTTTAYGTTVTATPSPLTGSTATAVSAVLTGLTNGTTYHYRVVGTNAIGTSNGTDMTFTPTNTLPIATTLKPTSVGNTTATLNGTVNANNSVTTVSFEYGTTTSYGSSMAATPASVSGSTTTDVSASLTGLTQGTTYHYRTVAINGFGTAYGADIMFIPGVGPAVTTDTISNITTTTATGGGNVTADGGSTVTARGICWSTSTNPRLSDSFTSDGSGLGTFTSSLTGLTENTTYYVRAYATNSSGTTYGPEKMFTTNTETVTVTITEPTEGEEVSGTVTIAASTTVSDAAFSVSKVEFYVDGSMISSHASAPYETDWDTTMYADGSHTIKAVAYNAANESSQDEVTVTVANEEAEIQVNRHQLNFGSVPGGSSSDGSATTSAQTVLVDNIGSGTLNWTASSDSSWLSVSPASGTGAGIPSVSVDATGLATGMYDGIITFSGSGSVNVAVKLMVYDSGTTSAPFGTFETPISNSTVFSSIPVTGWVLDDIEVPTVKIYRDNASGDGSGLVFIGDAVFVDGARPDVEQMYPDKPLNYQAGWGYMLLTNFLPNNGNGTFTLYAKATDKEGNTVTLGSKTITVDNANAVKPFGALDTPTQGGSAAGSSFVNWGWALTPQPNTIPTDGSTIKVWVDGVFLGNPVYNIYREDIATLFPGYNNSNGAVGYFYLDTMAYSNGVHTIQWSVTDDANNSDGIGSRYFSILNTGSSRNQARLGNDAETVSVKQFKREMNGASNFMGPVTVNKDFFNETQLLTTDLKGINRVMLKELEHVEIDFNGNFSRLQGHLKVAPGTFRPLPIGSTLDVNKGTFSWSPGPGQLGTYVIQFLLKDNSGNLSQRTVTFTIEPKFSPEKAVNSEISVMKETN